MHAPGIPGREADGGRAPERGAQQGAHQGGAADGDPGALMHFARELCGGQICVTPNAASFEAPETGPWLRKYYSINGDWVADDHRKLLDFARDLLNSD